jgi:hypothetical protein
VVPELRARGIGEMLDVAVALYRSRFTKLAPLVTIVVVPEQALSTVIALSARPENLSPGLSAGGTLPVGTGRSLTLAALVVTILLGWTLSATAVGLCARTLADSYVGATTPATRGTFQGIVAMLVTAALIALAELVGFFACFIGYLAVLAIFAVAVPIVMLEQARPVAALRRSSRLTSGHFWRVLGLTLTAAMLAGSLNLALSLGITALVRTGVTSTASILARGLAGTVAATLTTPFIAAAAIALYFDLRIRQEAFDVQLMMQRNDERHAAMAR